MINVTWAVGAPFIGMEPGIRKSCVRLRYPSGILGYVGKITSQPGAETSNRDKTFALEMDYEILVQ